MPAGGRTRRFVEHGDGQAVRSGRRAAMVVEPWPLVAVLLVVRIMNESRASCCPSWWQWVPLLGRILPDISPPMPVLSGGFFDAGGGPSCDMNADAERGVVPMMTAMLCILSGSRLDAMPTTSRPLVVRIVDGSARFVHDEVDAAGCSGSARRGRRSARGKNGFQGARLRFDVLCLAFCRIFSSEGADRPDEWSGFSLSDALGCDSRAVCASAYMAICVDDWTGSKWDVRMDGARAAMPSSWNRTMMPGHAMRLAGWSRRGSSLPVDAVGDAESGRARPWRS